MSSNPTVQELLERNKHYAANASPLPFWSEFTSVGLTPPHLIIVTCADPRCIPQQFLGLRPAEAIVIRNICGHAAPALNDILALDTVMGVTELMVIHHTDCGSLGFTNEQVRETLRKRQPNDKSIERMNFGSFQDLEQSVRDDLAIIKASPLMRKELVDRSYGFIYDVKTGIVKPLEG